MLRKGYDDDTDDSADRRDFKRIVRIDADRRRATKRGDREQARLAGRLLTSESFWGRRDEFNR